MRPLRLGLLVLTVVVIQAAVFPHLRIGGVVPDLGLVLALAVAVTDGPEAGAVVGFATGLGYDFFLETPLGCTALASGCVAYGAGVLEGGMLRSPRFAAPVVGFLGGLAGGVCFAVVGVLAGADVLLEARTPAVILAAALYDAVLALPVFALVRRLGAAEPDRPAVRPLR